MIYTARQSLMTRKPCCKSHWTTQQGHQALVGLGNAPDWMIVICDTLLAYGKVG